MYLNYANSPCITILRDTGLVGIRNQNPAEQLDVIGNIKLTGQLKFGDGSVIDKGFYLFKCKLNAVSDVATNDTWVTPSTPFSTGNVVYSVGAWNLGINGVAVPVAGYYEVNLNVFFDAVTGDRASMLVAIEINGVRTEVDYIANTYIRFASGDRGARSCNGLITVYLNAGDYVRPTYKEVGDSSVVAVLTVGSTVTLKRIGG